MTKWDKSDRKGGSLSPSQNVQDSDRWRGTYSELGPITHERETLLLDSQPRPFIAKKSSKNVTPFTIRGVTMHLNSDPFRNASFGGRAYLLLGKSLYCFPP